MNKESLLKKEFKERDIQRMRNLITNKHGDKTRTQIGYDKRKQEYEEGDIWEESGKVWTIKNGIKQNVTKFDEFKKMVLLPLACPCCNKSMKATLPNKKMYALHGKCFDCVIEMEHELRKQGKFEEYQKDIMMKNKSTEVDDLEQVLEAWLNEKDEFLTEQGDIEDWSQSTAKTEMYEEAKEVLKKVRDAEL
jgi:hypothetical protein